MDQILDLFPHNVTVHASARKGGKDVVIRMQMYDTETVQDMLDSACEYMRIIPEEACIRYRSRLLRPEHTMYQLRVPYENTHFHVIPNPNSNTGDYYEKDRYERENGLHSTLYEDSHYFDKKKKKTRSNNRRSWVSECRKVH